ncbi:hypothetical protein TNCV_3692501 [Trichonephila clavipes]|nr:hypothetical protein TNCV_3692501 [Trichonephila clavipes]
MGRFNLPEETVYSALMPGQNSSVKVIGRLIDSLYDVRGTAKKLISFTSTYCLKEPMELGRRQGTPCADLLRMPIRDFLEHVLEVERVVLKVDEGLLKSSASSTASAFPLLRRHAGVAAPQGP